jgi:ABC-type glycerol-3-phosphate transport system permease component
MSVDRNGVDKAGMKRLIIRAAIKIGVKSIVFTTIIGAVIGVIGYIKKWDSPVTYSNAFFLAGCVVLIAALSSRYAAMRSSHSPSFHTTSYHEMNSQEQEDYISSMSSSLSTVIFGVMSGLLLILISAIAAYMF